MAELLEEVTQAHVVAIMASARTAHAEGMAREKTVLLATARGEAVKAIQRVSVLGDGLVDARWAQDAVEENILSLTAEPAMAD
jgi:ribosomal protein L7/L12